MPRKLFTSLLDPSTRVTEDQLETDVNLLNMEKSILAINRRHFLGGLAAAGATAAIGATAFATPAEAQNASAELVQILNFALNLEYLEANLYISVSGAPPLANIEGGLAPINAPGKLALDAQTQSIAAAIAADETNHVALLQSAISSNGGTPVAQPAIDFSAGGKVTITTQAQFLAVARQFEAVGNSAYAAAAAYFIATPSLLTVAAQILGAEGQHMGAINYLCALQGVVSPPVDLNDYPPTTSPLSFFTLTPPTTQTDGALSTGPAVGPIRGSAQVLGIVYGVATAGSATSPTGVTSGGFFPKGVNGSIVST